MSLKLTVRQRQILGILNSQKERISGKEISEYLGVTDRTVRTDIRILADVLAPMGVRIDAVRGKGYLLISQNPGELQSIVYQESSALTPDDRMRAVLMILLEAMDPVQIDDLAEEFYVSRSTIEHDLRVIAFEYEREQPHIRLIRKRDSVALEYNEWKRRYVMNLLYSSRWNYNYEAGIHMEDLPVSEEEMQAIEETLTRVQAEEGISLSESDHVSFAFTIAIAVRRIRSGFHAGVREPGPAEYGADPESRKQDRPACGSAGEEGRWSHGGTELSGAAQVRAALDRILDRVGEFTAAPFSEEERCLMSRELAYRLQFGTLLRENEETGGRSTPYDRLIGELLAEADADYRLGFSGDRALRSSLSGLLMTQFRNPYHMGLRDEYVTRRVRAEHPDAVEIACRFAGRIRQETGDEVTENYLFELVAVLAEALERQAEIKRGSGIPVAVISHMTMGATRVLMTQIRRYFGNRIRLCGPLPVYKAMREGCGDADLAVATTKMKAADRSIPYLTIPRMMDSQNFERMDFLIALENYRKLYPGTGRWIAGKLTHWDIIPQVKAKRRWDILDEMTASLEKQGRCTREFTDGVFRRERQTSTAFREGFALAHAQTGCGAESGLVLLNLDSPADWGGISVDQVFLLYVSEALSSEQMRIYAALALILRRLKQQKLLGDLPDGEALRRRIGEAERRG